jgi:hypothetical protein
MPSAMHEAVTTVSDSESDAEMATPVPSGSIAPMRSFQKSYQGVLGMLEGECHYAVHTIDFISFYILCSLS